MSLGFRSRTLVTLAALLCSKSAFSASPDTSTMVCQRPDVIGLYEQCEEAAVVGFSGDKIRVYGKAQKQVLTVPKNQVFVAKKGSKHAALAPRQLIAVPGQNLWNQSRPGFRSLCSIEKVSSSGYVTLSCGRYQKETIHLDSVYSFTPYDPGVKN